ncbi:hypothetical protein FHX49_001096 [Microbacterium endophyticum]|uniref:Glycosyltransferase family 1 protein n=1 Tax=Microbacterium endophyticum TaxID=1526412 RepID=A0A7W4V3B7_9MICO|nr:glycosyltransferase [Microbacterium endophyticum]MBB2975530.1 hypothetical protein [Microbacterium endophyticum]NIK35451.1 hypothetical protein [Microbacterium endophyticum]
MQHLGGTGLKRTHFRDMREASDFDFIYHEADPYLAPLHPLPKEAAIAGSFADVVFTVGSGRFSNAFRRAGANDVRWEPSPFDPERYPVPKLSGRKPQHDVVIIANRNRPRLRGLPNWRDRIRFVGLMQEAFGERLAIYGNGWNGVGALGPVPFELQTQAIASGLISANWDHFAREPKYFSNRLPISLLAGGVHATTLHDGYGEIFGRGTEQFLITARTPEALVERIERRLQSGDRADWHEAAVAGRSFALEHFRQDDQLVRFLNFRHEIVDPIAARRAWDLSSTPLEEM